jgi:signal-transduction protein with cAMP-binding, CBS, and nucleotidyltransferase domain
LTVTETWPCNNEEGLAMLKELVTCPAVTCPSDATVTEAAAVMAERGIGLVVVVDATQKPMGVVTDRDIVVRAVARGRHDATVADVMTRHPASVRVDASVGDAARLMADRQCRRLAVVDAAGATIGVLSLDDLLREAGDELGEIARAVRGPRFTHLSIP